MMSVAMVTPGTLRMGKTISSIIQTRKHSHMYIGRTLCMCEKVSLEGM